MDKLSNLRLPKSAVALNGREMKAISGGYGWGCSTSDLCSGPCMWQGVNGHGDPGVCRVADGSGADGGPIGMTCTCGPLN